MSTQLETARELLQSGRMQEAEQAFERALEEFPEDLQALNVVALGALRNGRHDWALELLTRARRVDASDAVTNFHLGKVHEAAGAAEAAAAAYGAAVAARPEFYVARLAYAAALERCGQADRALIQYARSLKDAQSQQRWLDPGTTPESLRPLVAHAVRTFRSGRRQLFARIIEPLRSRYGAPAMTRMEKCLRIYLREEPAHCPDPRQAPSFLYFPDLPTSPYFDRRLLAWVDALEQRTPAIHEELLEVMASTGGRERVFSSEELEQQHLRGSGAAPSWTGYYFWRHGRRRDDNCSQCPSTALALEALPLARVRDHAPEVLYSVFTPGTHLLPHRGVTNTRAVAHLPLIVPEDCALVVGGKQHVWEAGHVVAFDDTYEHEAWNRSAAIRVVLILDIWNPHLTEAEQGAVADIVAAIGDLREGIAEA